MYYDMQNKNKIQNSQIQFSINDQLCLETLLEKLRSKTISYVSFKNKYKLHFPIFNIKRVVDKEIPIYVYPLRRDMAIKMR